MERFDLIVVGGGSGGVRAARRAAQAGARVLLAEGGALGGTCVNVGCVPKKLLYYAAEFPRLARLARGYGFGQASAGGFAWRDLIERKNAEIARLNGVYDKILGDAGVRVARGWACLADAHTVHVGEARYAAERILLATGGEPARPNFPGAELAALSDDLFFLPELPRHITLIGGGYIALEFTGIFAELGAEVTLCYRADLPMRGLDDDVRRRLRDGLCARGISLAAGMAPVAIARDGDYFLVRLDNEARIDADLVVAATGRRPRTAQLNLAAAGIAPSGRGGTLQVDADYATSCPSVYAVGDLIDSPALTPVAIAEAEVFVRRVFGGEGDAAVDYDAVPTAIFSRPGVALAGLSEAAAKKRGIDVQVFSSAFRPMRSAFGGEESECFVKLICAGERVLGAQMVGDDAAEIMQGFAVAIRAGATRADFAATAGIHPSSAEEFVTMDMR